MPILRKHQINNHFKGYEEIDEHSPFFDPFLVDENEIGVKENPNQVDSIWKKWWAIILGT